MRSLLNRVILPPVGLHIGKVCLVVCSCKETNQSEAEKVSCGDARLVVVMLCFRWADVEADGIVLFYSALK